MAACLLRRGIVSFLLNEFSTHDPAGAPKAPAFYGIFSPDKDTNAVKFWDKH